jgi:hypothetical protein
VIRSLLGYARSFAAGLADGQVRALMNAHRRGASANIPPDPRQALRDAVGYLLRAQEQGTDAGMGSYHLTHGWGASYPETTGYAIPTLLRAGRHLPWAAPEEAAVRAGEWLMGIQRVDGGWPGGRVGEGRPGIVFNTAQVVRGMLALHAHTGEDRFLDAALRAGRWIAAVQEPDGAWRAANFLGVARVYDTYVDAPLLQLAAATGEEGLRQSALRNLEWCLAQQRPNGWFANADNTVRHNDRPITHTIAYTLDGLLECATLLNDDRYRQAATIAARALATDFLAKGRLHGRYDKDWRGSEHAIMTGTAQLAIVWDTLGADPDMRRARDGAMAWLMAVQRLSAQGPAAVHGAMPGSFPLWGRYEKFAFPNWGTKYFADALLCMPGPERPAHA